MALYFYFNETTGDLVYSDQATYGAEGYMSLGEQVNLDPNSESDWVFHSHRITIVTVSKDKSIVGKIDGLKSMGYMFSRCGNLASLDLSGFDTSAVTNMGNMFYGCTKLTSLDVSGFDTSAVTDMRNMFASCSSLTSLDLSGFDSSTVTSMSGMFYSCTNLTSLDLSGFDTSAVTDMGSMFIGCTSLRLVTISDKMSNVLSQLPADQYYPSAGGSPVAKTDLTAGTWVRDEADLTKVTSIVQQAQMQQAISRRIGSLRRDLEARIREASALLDQLDFAAGGLIPVENGGTGATTAAQARTNLGITPANIGAATTEDVQGLQDSLSQAPSLTSYVSDLGGSHVTMVGTTCYIKLFLRATHGFAANFNLTTLPEAYRPTKSAFVTAEVGSGGEMSVIHGDVTTEGKVTVPKTIVSGDTILLWGAWAVEL